MTKLFVHSSLVLALLLLLGGNKTFAQAPLCDGVECAPNPGSSTYPNALASRSKLLNARGSRNPLAPVTASASSDAPTVIGSQSFNKVFPVLNLPGRQGMDLSLGLYYNSRVWDIDSVNSTATFNIDRDFPSYGFRLDFGFLEYDSANDQYIVTESDGSKHDLPNSAGNYDSIDGTYMRYTVAQGVLTYKNGTQVFYKVFPSQASQSTPTLFRPSVARNSNGNFISYYYVSGKDQALSSIVDTLGRTINFNYDSSGHLTSVSQNTSSGTKNWITFTWGTITLDYNFSLTVNDTAASGSTVNVITGCTYPNGTGYVFHYGHWGIINRIDTVSSSGALRAYSSYNFPDASTALSDAPAYTQQTVSPDGTAQLIWKYAYTNPSTGVTTSLTVTDPVGNQSVTNLDSNGFLVSVQSQNSAGTALRTTGYSWIASGVGTVASKITTTLNDTGQQSSVEFSYDIYGNATDVYEYDFGHVLKRHTVTTFLGGGYIPWWHILDLPTRVTIIDGGSGTTVSRTDFNYDEYSVTPMMSVTGAQNHDDGYDTTVTTRGNLTSVVRYSNASAGTGPITRSFTFDTLGNMRTAQLDCCNQQTLNFSSLNQYAYVNSEVRGSAPIQFTTSYTYDNDSGLMLTSTDENGQQTQYQYDSMLRRIQTKPPAQNGTSVQFNTSYDDAAVSPTVTSSNSFNSAVSINTLNGLGWMLRSDSRNGNTLISSVAYSYDGAGRRTSTSNPFAPGDTVVYTTTSYDALGRQTSIAPPSSGAYQFVYAGNAVTTTDPAGKQRQTWTDALGRLVEVDEPGWGDALPGTGSATIYGTENFLQICSDTDPPICHNVYDSGMVYLTVNGLTKSAIYGNGTLNTDISATLGAAFNGDNNSSVTASVSGAKITFTAKTGGASTNYSISTSSVTNDPTDFGGPSFSASLSGPTLTGGENTVIQANAVLTSSRRAVTKYAYDIFNNLLSVSQAAMGPVQGQQLTGQVRNYSYDNLSRRTITTTPESGTVTIFYTDKNGNSCAGDISLPCRVKDARNITKTVTYDSINRPIGVQYDDGITPGQTFSYDSGAGAGFAVDRLVTFTDGNNSQSFSYDNWGQVTSINNSFDQISYSVGYGYNLLGQLTSLTYPSGRIVQRNVDNIGRLSEIKSGSTNYLNNLSYNAAGQALGFSFGNGIQAAFGYNDHLQLSSLRYYKPNTSSDVLNLTYDYTTGVPGNNGQIQVVHYNTSGQPNSEDPRGSEYFSYDPLGRLTSAHTGTVSTTIPGTWNLSWTYDRLGNRLSQKLNDGNISVYQPSFSVDPNTNWITNSGYQNDNAGNLTNDGVNTYTYDGANRLIQFNGSASSYGYLGQLRIKKVVGSSSTVYLYSGYLPIAEYSNGTLSAENIYAGSQLLAVVTPSSTTYYHHDHISTRATTDTTGNVVANFGVLPFGDQWYSQGNTTKWQFTNYERDAESNNLLDYAKFRSYSYAQGRFMNADLLSGNISNPQSLNRYSYVLGDPVNKIDPLGLVSPPTTCNGVPIKDKDGVLVACLPLLVETLDLSPIEPYGIEGIEGPQPACTLKIRVNNQNKVPADWLAAIENQIANLFSPAAVGVEFVNGGDQKADAVLNFEDPGPITKFFNLDNDGSHTIKGGGPSFIHSGVISDAFQSRTRDVKNMITGTVAAHELLHQLLQWPDVPANRKEKNDIMAADDIRGMNYYLVNNLFKLTRHELERLLEDCLFRRSKH